MKEKNRMISAEHTIKSLMDDLQIRRAALEAQMCEFEQLQQHIILLQQRARQDPKARHVLQKLADTMQNEGNELQTLFEDKLCHLQNSLDMLDYHFRSLLSTTSLPPRYERQLPRCYTGLRHIQALL